MEQSQQPQDYKPSYHNTHNEGEIEVKNSHAGPIVAAILGFVFVLGGGAVAYSYFSGGLFNRSVDPAERIISLILESPDKDLSVVNTLTIPITEEIARAVGPGGSAADELPPFIAPPKAGDEITLELAGYTVTSDRDFSSEASLSFDLYGTAGVLARMRSFANKKDTVSDQLTLSDARVYVQIDRLDLPDEVYDLGEMLGISRDQVQGLVGQWIDPWEEMGEGDEDLVQVEAASREGDPVGDAVVSDLVHAVLRSGFITFTSIDSSWSEETFRVTIHPDKSDALQQEIQSVAALHKGDLGDEFDPHVILNLVLDEEEINQLLANVSYDIQVTFSKKGTFPFTVVTQVDVRPEDVNEISQFSIVYKSVVEETGRRVTIERPEDVMTLSDLVSQFSLDTSGLLESAGQERMAAKDSARISNLRQLQTALELYYTDKAGYPAVSSPVLVGTEGYECLNADGFTSPNCKRPYMGETVMRLLPDEYYVYATPEAGGYILGAVLLTEVGGLGPGPIFATPRGLTDDSSELNLSFNEKQTLLYYLDQLKVDIGGSESEQQAQNAAMELMIQEELDNIELPDGASAQFSGTWQPGMPYADIPEQDYAAFVVYVQDRIVNTQIGLFNTDTDNDGLSDGIEQFLKTDPKRIDTDGDGYPDGEELTAGYDPLSNRPLPAGFFEYLQQVLAGF